MKKPVFLLSAACLCLFSCSSHAAGDGGGDTDAPDSAKTDTVKTPDEPPASPITDVVKKGKKVYTFQDEGETYYLTFSYSIQWPQKSDAVRLTALQDSIAKAAFGVRGNDIDNLCANFLKGRYFSFAENLTLRPYDGYVPEDMNSWSTSTDVKRLQVTPDYATYMVENYDYEGGAHGSYGSVGITAAMSDGRVLTPLMLFNRQASVQAIRAAITRKLARDNNCRPDELGDKGYFIPEDGLLPMPDNVYLVDGEIACSYFPYGIAPWSMGQVTINLRPADNGALLSPLAKKLLTNR